MSTPGSGVLLAVVAHDGAAGDDGHLGVRRVSPRDASRCNRNPLTDYGGEQEPGREDRECDRVAGLRR